MARAGRGFLLRPNRPESLRTATATPGFSFTGEVVDVAVAAISGTHSCLGVPATISVTAIPGAFPVQLSGAVSEVSVTAEPGTLVGIPITLNGVVADVPVAAPTGAFYSNGYVFSADEVVVSVWVWPGSMNYAGGAVSSVSVEAHAGTGPWEPITLSGVTATATVNALAGWSSSIASLSASATLTGGSALTNSDAKAALTATSSLTATPSTYLMSETSEGVDFALGSRAWGEISLGAADYDFTKINARTLMRVSLTVSDPAIIAGRPYYPTWWAQPVVSTSVAGNHKIVPRPDPPEPVYPPLPVGNSGSVKAYRWLAADAKPGLVTTWPEHNGGPSWASTGNYRPVQGAHGTFRRGTEYIHTAGVYFHYDQVEHMWMSLPGSVKEMTWVIAGILFDYPHRRYGHYLLDAGTATPTLTPTWDDQLLGQQGLGHRSLMLMQRTNAILCTRPVVEDGIIVRTQHNLTPQPRVMWGVFNGSKSAMGVFGRNYVRSKTGTTDAKSHKDFVTGRRFNKVSKELGSHMVLFEMRFFPYKLSYASLQEQYKSLAGTYKFNKYRR